MDIELIKQKTNLKICTWNVLSSNLTHYFVTMLPESREELIFNKIKEWIEDDAIICLQEVDSDMWTNIKMIATRCGYLCHRHTIRGPHTGFMSTVIMYPKTLDVIEIDVLNTSEIIHNIYSDFMIHPKQSKSKPSLCQKLANIFKRKPTTTKPQETPLNAASKHSNYIPMIRFKHDGDIITVAAVHLSCLYWNPTAQEIQLREFLNYWRRLNKDMYWVLAGDFNYKWGTNPKLDTLLKDCKLPKDTTTCWSKSAKSEFRGKIDYILSNVSNTSYQLGQLDAPSPNLDFPSDHCWASITINKL